MSWAGGSTRRWRNIRAAVLPRDRAEGWDCRAHQEGWCARSRASPHTCARTMVHAHHTRGRRVTGDDPAYIVGACAPCNLAIGDPTRNGDPACVPVTDWSNRCT